MNTLLLPWEAGGAGGEEGEGGAGEAEGAGPAEEAVGAGGAGEAGAALWLIKRRVPSLLHLLLLPLPKAMRLFN